MVTYVDCESCGGVGYLRCENCICKGCKGTGKVCSDCNDGKIKCAACVGGKIECQQCGGYGKILKKGRFSSSLETCIYCEGLKQTDCYICKGSGFTACASCRGVGVVTCSSCGGKGSVEGCTECGGTRKIQCGNCLGQGKFERSIPSPISVAQPSAAHEHQSLTYKPAGDVQVTTRIAFERYGDNIPELPKGIYTINPDGSDCQRILTEGKRPKWSPDGQWIAFVESTADNEGLSSIFVMRPNGQEVRRLTVHHDLDVTPPSWSPDSKQIVYSLGIGKKNFTKFALWICSQENSAKLLTEKMTTLIRFGHLITKSYLANAQTHSKAVGYSL